MQRLASRFFSSIAAVGLVAAMTNACDQDDELCPVSGYGACGGGGFQCTDFQPGTDMSDTDFGGDLPIKGQIQAYAQASGNLAVLAGNALAAVTGACRNIAVDLGDDPANEKAKGKTGTDLLTFWCDDAVSYINVAFTRTGTAKGLLSLGIVPPECRTSLASLQRCQAACSPGVACDLKSTPPTCSGGMLDIECNGDCDLPSTSPAIDCVGACGGRCAGTCIGSSAAPVHCNGVCDGLCTALVAPDTGSGSGRQLDGGCEGECDGTCTTSPGALVMCSGTCDGTCDAACTRTPGQSSVLCSGACTAGFEPYACNGGVLTGGCDVETECQSNCNASAQAVATCTPALAVVTSLGSAVVTGTEGTFAALLATLRTNLPTLLMVIQGEGQPIHGAFAAVVDGAMSITSSNELDVKSTGCLAAMVAAAEYANQSFTVALAEASKVSVAVGGPGS